MNVSVDGLQGMQSGLIFPEESQHAPSKNPASLPYRILLVDDDGTTRQLLTNILEQYQDVEIVGHACDGHEAVALALEYKPDVILMDIALPHLDGIGATHCIKSMCPRTVVICLTGHFSPESYTAMRTAGASAFVCKNQVLAIHDMIMGALGKWTDSP
jgi:DNA-binding NarL/FixJ family response regulator